MTKKPHRHRIAAPVRRWAYARRPLHPGEPPLTPLQALLGLLAVIGAAAVMLTIPR